MKAVVSAIEAGRASVAVSGALLNDPDVLLALKDRAAFLPMALSGPSTGPVGSVNDKGLARAIAQPNGVLVLIEPERVDNSGLESIAKIMKTAAHKPTIYVVARSYNPFAFGALSGLKIEHIKGRGKNFLRDLPTPAADLAPVVVAEVPKVKSKRAKAGDRAPRFVFVGRDEELEALNGLLAEPGPIVVSGPHGIGKRSLVEQALAAGDLHRLPDFTLGRDLGFDALTARLALFCQEHGAPQLASVLKKKDSTPSAIIAAAVESLGAVEHDAVMLLEGLHTALGRQRDFFRKSRLEMLLIALLTSPSRIRLVFTSADQPILYREGQAQHLRRLELDGLKGRFLHEIFAAYKAPEFPRDRFGAISEKIEGHPLAARAYAVDVRDRDDGLKLTEDPKFLKLEGSLDKLKRRLGRKVERLTPPMRAALAAVCHVPHVVTTDELSALGFNRQTRLELLAQGLLDMTGTPDDRRYRVHPLVRSQLTWRETSDFDVYRGLADRLWTQMKDATGMEQLVMQQEFNLYCTASRQHRRRVNMPFPDNDSMVESCYGMVRSKKPNFQLARQRLAEIVNAQPANADAHLLRLELSETEQRAHGGGGRRRGRGRKGEEAPKPTGPAPKDDFEALAAEAVAQAPVPEIFHRITGHWLSKRKRNKAITALEGAVEALPEEARLYCRLGALQLREGRREQAVASLKKAMELQPMLPDAYGLLGMTRRDEGPESAEEAESLLREAVRLAPEDPVQTARLADLLIDKAAGIEDAGARSDVFAEAKELLETALRGDRKAPEAQLLLAQLHRRSGGDLERADWLLKQARKNSDRGAERHHRINLERALIDLARGNVDAAEATARDTIARNPHSHTAFATLAAVLEARQQFIPAHAEILRAKGKAPEGSLWQKGYDADLLRLQGLIEAQAAGTLPAPEPAAAPAAAEGAEKPEATGNTAHRVIRRKRADGEAVETAPEAVETAPEAVETAPEAVETAPEEVETAPEAVETAPEEVETPADETAPEAVADPGDEERPAEG
jgi:tetratricopeptide (TPR) repeat protein